VNLPKLLTPEEAASILGVTKATLEVWRSTKRYNLPFVKSGRLVRYRESDLAKFIEERLRGGQPEGSRA
jgi:excisionase family DNA binding protein